MNRLAGGVFRALLHLYPSSFRHEYGHEMADAFEARTAGRGALTAALDAIADVVPNALAAQAAVLTRDIRHAFRLFARAPRFHAGLIAVLALGIGANGAVLSILYAVLLHPLPYRDANRVVMVWGTQPFPTDPLLTRDDRFAFSHRVLAREQFDVLASRTADVLSGIAAVRSWQTSLDASFDLSLSDRTERLRGAFVTSNFFDLLGVRPRIGRLFSASDASNVPEVAISYGLWQRVYGGDPDIVGRTLDVIGGRAPRGPRSFIVTAVLPPEFRFTYPEETEVFALEPAADLARFPGNSLALYTVARIKPGVRLAAVNARLATVREKFERPGVLPAFRNTARAEPIRDWVVGNARPPLLLLGGVAALLLVITCLTTTNALFVRAAARRREVAVRAALGANPARLRRELLTQGATLAAAGTVAGTGLAMLVAPLVRALLPASLPRADEIGVNVWIFGFAAMAATVTTVLATAAPAWGLSRVPLVVALRNATAAASSNSATRRWRALFVGSQSAVATSLLIVAALLMTSLWRLGRVPLGFDGHDVLTVEMRLLDARFRDKGTMQVLQRNLVAAVQAVPGVADVGLTSAVPFRGVDFMVSVSPTGESDNAKRVSPNLRQVDSGYFAVMRMGLVRGRTFSAFDTPESERVAVVSESFAHSMFGDADAIGRLIDDDPPKRIVGIVRDVRYVGFEHEARPALYVARSQSPEALICLVVRLKPGARDVANAIRGAIHRVDPGVPTMRLTTIDQILRESMAARRFYTIATVSFAVVALALTLVGLAVVVSRSVIERQRELAVRAALGASASRLIRQVMAQGMRPVIAGSLAGVFAAFACASLLTAFVFQVPARNPLTYVSIFALLAACGAIAALLPARRVSATSPATVLRSD